MGLITRRTVIIDHCNKPYVLNTDFNNQSMIMSYRPKNWLLGYCDALALPYLIMEALYKDSDVKRRHNASPQLKFEYYWLYSNYFLFCFRECNFFWDKTLETQEKNDKVEMLLISRPKSNSARTHFFATVSVVYLTCYHFIQCFRNFSFLKLYSGNILSETQKVFLVELEPRSLLSWANVEKAFSCFLNIWVLAS